MKVPLVYRFIIKYVTPLFILTVFVGSLIKPSKPWGDSFSDLFSGNGWSFAPGSVIGKLLHVGVTDYAWFNAAGGMTNYFVEDMTRLLLLLLFIGCAALVFVALNRKKEPAQ